MHFEKTKYHRFLILPVVMFLVVLICVQGILTSSRPGVYVVAAIFFGVLGMLLLLSALWFMYRTAKLISKVMTAAERFYHIYCAHGNMHSILVGSLHGFFERLQGGKYRLSVMSTDGSEYRTYVISETSLTEASGIPVDRDEALQILTGLQVAIFAATHVTAPGFRSSRSS